MKNSKFYLKKAKTSYKLLIFLYILICVVVGVLCFQYYKQLQKTVKAESKEYLQEISNHMGGNISKTINDTFSVLGTIATVLRTADVTTYDEMQSVVREQQHNWSYQHIMLVDAEGVAYDAERQTITLGSDKYLQDVLLSGKRSLSSTQMVNGVESIVFAIPIEGITIDGKPMAALAASYESTTFDRSLSMSAFDGKGYAHIVTRDGTAVIRSSSEEAPRTGYNILNSVAAASGDRQIEIAEITKEMMKGGSGQIEVSIDGSKQYMVYTPLATQEWYLLSFVPASVVNAKSDMFLKITIMICGMVTGLFTLLFGIIMASYYRHQHKLEQIAYVDSITGGHTIERFYELAHDLLYENRQISYAVVFTNIEKFKVLNEQFGREACNKILCATEKGIAAKLNEQECIGRIAADNFCILMQYQGEEELGKRFNEWYLSAAKYITERGEVWLPLIMEFGVYTLEDIMMPFPHMIDRAKLALREAVCESCGKLRYAVYDEQVRRQLFREKHLEDMMEEALENREFQVYLQPKYKTKEEVVGGAEALVRWVSPKEGMIYPDEFISLFEKNGFILQLDLWVFEEVCKTIQSWIHAGLEPVRVSVNCSRVHLKSPGFLKRYAAVFERYSIPSQYIEIELTENVVFDDVAYLTDTIKQIHALGFYCSMDDFGSGYSSLNLIQDIPVDVLKLDKIFFRNETENQERMESVVSSILIMARALSMDTVAEGVEKRSQVEMLKKYGCDYIQGYYYAKPMPIAQFERLTFAREIADAE